MIEISEIDKKHLDIIRKSVDSFITKMVLHEDYYNTTILDVAPQIYDGLKSRISLSKVLTLDIDPESKADIIADLCNDNSDKIQSNYFDSILCTEVLEHTLQPFKAADELYRIIKPGGKLYLTTPFNFRIHGPLPDCWRFSEHGLRSIFSNWSSIQIESVESERGLFPIQYKSIITK
tara:strand:+ start:1465 stop:1995 length:531 start_codon:yes stop_codon:yes gene_type:complete